MKNQKQSIQKPYDPLEVGLPCSPWVEELILGIALFSPHRMDEMAAVVTIDDFSSENNRLVWTACAALHYRGVPPVVQAVCEELNSFGQLESVTVSYIVKIHNEAIEIPDPQKYIRVLRDFAQRRKAIYKANEILLTASSSICDIGSLLEDASDSFSRLGAALTPDAAFKFPKDILQEMGGLNAYAFQATNKTLITTPFRSLNENLQAGGFVAGDLIILAGHTSRGKSALAVNMALHAVERGKTIALVSLEMHEGSIFDRMVSITGNIDGYKLHRESQNMIEEQGRRKTILDAVNRIIDKPIAVSYRPGISPKKLISDLKRFKAVNGLDLVIVDYLQLMSGNEKAWNRSEEVGQVSRALKRMAGELNVPLIALSQFSRESAKTDREPEVFDLRESGTIEQDASVVMLMHVTKPWDIASGVEKGEVKLKLAKQRTGVTTHIMLEFEVKTGNFTEIRHYDRDFAK